MTKNLVYTEKYVPFTRDVFMEKIASKLSEKRFAHVCRVEQKALQLAEMYNYSDLEQVSIAALAHDYAKERPDGEMIHLIETKKMDLNLITFGNSIWHGVAGAELVRDELHVTDEDILQAIRLHTTGAANMSELDKILYVADYIEDGRDFPVVAEAREIAEKSLDAAVAFETQQVLKFLIEHNHKIYPKTIETYNRWVAD
ncbi:bis(5'-nucleosyl)-tetraphosphatase (symmetrical) YqeK [Vagococcus vulneris]|uniref:bis(5'-nucleosyl)-tetraphosphatase (symmetrical) n=1 Tax=Vagococcus vulneris TaxID=1977869 RepID=A0A430A185_9ENTE|nr:bis(5'-nucleosyl)-tetraphosphatase (symmetrical) YqeK [Vagococcus vulneris]RSU00158.1 HD domain-containing protein [Vagococcus vulneris]